MRRPGSGGSISVDQIHVEDVTAEDLAVEDVLPRHARRRAKAAGNAVTVAA